MTTILMISGSLRRGSTNTALVSTAAALSVPGVSVEVYQGLAGLPHFNPDDDQDPLDPAVDGLRSAIRSADAIMVSTPEYAGALPGSFKNVLDWAVGDGQIGSIYEKPVAWVNASSTGGAANAHRSLRIVLGYVNARIVESACVELPVPRQAVGADGLITDERIRSQLADALSTLADAAVSHPVGDKG